MFTIQVRGKRRDAGRGSRQSVGQSAINNVNPVPPRAFRELLTILICHPPLESCLGTRWPTSPAFQLNSSRNQSRVLFWFRPSEKHLRQRELDVSNITMIGICSPHDNIHEIDTEHLRNSQCGYVIYNTFMRYIT